MATTSDLRGDNAWTWPCPYCGQPNSLDAVSCSHCGVQLRDPDEEELFTTVATENAQVVDPDAPSYRESLWSTDSSPGEEGVVDAEPVGGPEPDLHIGPRTHGAGAPDAAATGPFSAAASPPPSDPPPPGPTGTVFGSQVRLGEEQPWEGQADRNVFGAGPAPAAQAPTPEPPRGRPERAAPGAEQWQSQAQSFQGATAPPDPFQEAAAPRATPDPHGLSVAVESLTPADRERCAVPIGVCGALLGEQEVVLGAMTGHLLGHPAIVVLTNQRVIVANARRWKPLVDVFRPGPDLVVHTRHDRDVAAMTFVQGQNLTSVDDITDVAAALDLAERIKAVAGTP